MTIAGDMMPISLLWPPMEDHEPCSDMQSSENLVKDLSLDEVIREIGMGSGQPLQLRMLMAHITDRPEVIRYRLDIVEDLNTYSEFQNCIREMLPLLDELAHVNDHGLLPNSEIRQFIMRVSELEIYVECINKLKKGFEDHPDLKAEGLRRLKEKVEGIAASQTFAALSQELPEMRAGLSSLASITIGVNLDAQLRPVEATLISINDQPYRSGDIIDRFLRLDFGRDEFRGLAPLQVMVRGSGPEAERQNQVFNQAVMNGLEKVLRAAIRPIAPRISQFTRVSSQFLVDLRPELIFYLGLTEVIEAFRALGLPMCRPEVSAREERACRIQGLYNLNLALQLHGKYPNESIKDRIVKNDCMFNEHGRIYILTGPNQGGKTVYTQAVGQAQLLFQLGCYVPGTSAVMSPADKIFTHFPVEERPDSNLGRMGEECSRLGEIFNQATRYSLVLLNESLSSTSPGEGLYIAKEILLGLRLMGARAVFATHFHELGSNLQELNASTPGDSTIDSLVAGVEEGSSREGGFSTRSYKIQRKPPQGMSYAKEIATRYGVSIEKIRERLKDRDLISQELNEGEA